MSGEQYQRKEEEIKVPKPKLPYSIDLTKIGGSGEFPCPKCGTEISPSDETENVYQILETGVKNDELEYVIVQCNKCGSTIKLEGFLSHSSYKPAGQQEVI
jgi:predicted RNA-binding Zn-ribbon protein involved in translation (DUF1610 family)